MKKIHYKDNDFKDSLKLLYNRPSYPAEIEASVAGILADVREKGNKAIKKYAKMAPT